MIELRPIYRADMDKRRPVLILTRPQVIPFVSSVSVAPITTSIRGLSTEVGVGRHNGLNEDSVVHCDTITTVKKKFLLDHIGYLLAAQEPALAAAITAAFDLTHRLG